MLKAAWLIDKVGPKGARTEIATIKVAAPRAALNVLDRAIQLHGGAGASQDFPLAGAWAGLRTLRLADGPDEVHLRTIARMELGRRPEGTQGTTMRPRPARRATPCLSRTVPADRLRRVSPSRRRVL